MPPERRFVGFDAYRDVIACCDVVLLCSPPHFRPMHLKAAVEAGKHVFAEKPVAVDAPGARSVLATCALAKKKTFPLFLGYVCVATTDFAKRFVEFRMARLARFIHFRPMIIEVKYGLSRVKMTGRI